MISLLICISAWAHQRHDFHRRPHLLCHGTEHRLYAWLGRWSPRWQTPARSLLVQAAVTLALVVGFGMSGSGFNNLVIFTTPVFYAFFLLVGVTCWCFATASRKRRGLFACRAIRLVPILFCLSSSFMLYGSISWAYENTSHEAFWSIVIMLVGVVLSWFDRR